MSTAPPTARALWPLPLAAALLPLVAVAIAYLLSIRLDLAPACNPFVDGCVSISRAARHGLPNIVFRALVLPAAVLQALCWLLCATWLRSLDPSAAPDAHGRRARRWQRALPWIGVVAALFLVLYASFLGTDGHGYRLMRRYGTVVYFGFTCIAMLIVAGAIGQRLRGDRRQKRVGKVLVALCAALPLLGLVHVLLPLALPGAASKDALENITEWWAGAIFTAFFVALAWAWHRSGFHARLDSRVAG